MAGPICNQVKQNKWYRKYIKNLRLEKPYGWTDAQWEDYIRRL